MPSLAEYLEQADLLAQEVVNAEGENRRAGKATSIQFNELVEKARRHLYARHHADKRRQFNDLSEPDVAEEKAARQAFAEAYKVFHEKYDPFQPRPD